ncbi:Uncharacterised protein [Mycobacteroides abscessus subsp. abscessus]|nr:Uncharacterised protein [Mycobacteroides abscessus subsp. abscessus]
MATFAEISVPGSSLEVAPVAMMMLSAVTSWTEPLSSVTLIDFGPLNSPQPLISVILFFFIR